MSVGFSILKVTLSFAELDLGDRLGDPARQSRLLEQVRARSGLRHLPYRAAEVHVDDVGAGGLHHPRRLSHRRRLGAEDLDGERVLVRTDP